MTIIEKNSDFVTLINFFTVDQSKQKILVDMLIEGAEQIMKKQGASYQLTYIAAWMELL